MTTRINGAKQASSQPVKGVKPQPKPKNKPISVMVGGVKYDANDVKSHSTTRGMLKFDGVYADAEFHEVVLKDGTKVTYNSSLKKGDWNNTNERNLAGQAEVQIEKDGTVNFKGLHHAQITDTPKDDTYRLLGCEFTHVEAARTKDETSGIVFVDHEITGADKDKMIFGDRELPNGEVQKSIASSVTVASGDTVVARGNGEQFGDYISPLDTKGEYQTVRGFDTGSYDKLKAELNAKVTIDDNRELL